MPVYVKRGEGGGIWQETRSRNPEKQWVQAQFKRDKEKNSLETASLRE